MRFIKIWQDHSDETLRNIVNSTSVDSFRSKLQKKKKQIQNQNKKQNSHRISFRTQVSEFYREKFVRPTHSSILT